MDRLGSQLSVIKASRGVMSRLAESLKAPVAGATRLAYFSAASSYLSPLALFVVGIRKPRWRDASIVDESCSRLCAQDGGSKLTKKYPRTNDIP
jgi:hypothetical protein